MNAPDIDFHDFADDIFDAADERGEQTERADEFALDMQKEEFLAYINNANYVAGNKFATDNKISCKFFVDYFARQMGAEAQKRRKEITKAAEDVFGERYMGRFWLLDDLRKRSDELKHMQYDSEHEVESNEKEEKDKLPF